MVCALFSLDREILEDLVVNGEAVNWTDTVDWANMFAWADAVRLYKPDNAMEMIGHDDEFIFVEDYFLANAHGAQPFILSHFP